MAGTHTRYNNLHTGPTQYVSPTSDAVLVAIAASVLLVYGFLQWRTWRAGERTRIVRSGGSVIALRKALESDPDLSGADAEGRTIVHVAIVANSLHLLPLLAEYNAPFDTVDKQGMSPLHLATTAAQVSALAHVAAEVLETNGASAANKALRDGNAALAQALLDSGVNLDSSSLWYAVPNVPCMEIASRYWQANGTHLDRAIAVSSLSAVEWVLKKGVAPTQDQLRAAIQTSNLPISSSLFGVLPRADAARTAMYTSLQMVPLSGTVTLQWALPLSVSAGIDDAAGWFAHLEEAKEERCREEPRLRDEVAAAEDMFSSLERRTRDTRLEEAPYLARAAAQLAEARAARSQADELESQARSLTFKIIAASKPEERAEQDDLERRAEFLRRDASARRSSANTLEAGANHAEQASRARIRDMERATAAASAALSEARSAVTALRTAVNNLDNALLLLRTSNVRQPSTRKPGRKAPAEEEMVFLVPAAVSAFKVSRAGSRSRRTR